MEEEGMKEMRHVDTTVWKTGVQCKSGSNTVRQQQILGVEEGPGFKGFAVRNPSQIHLSHSNLGEAGWATSLLICCSAAKRGIKEKERRIFGEQFLSLRDSYEKAAQLGANKKRHPATRGFLGDPAFSWA